LVSDKSGNLYGSSLFGGTGNAGTVFKLTRSSSGYTESVFYNFTGGSDGGNPHAALILDSAGNLYGTTSSGGSSGFGTVFELKNSNGSWTESVLHTFAGGSDGASPYASVIFDTAGNLYGTTSAGGSNNSGTIFELKLSNGTWKEKVLYSFTGGNDGASPNGLTFDSSGNLYGTSSSGGSKFGGNVFELKHTASGWKQRVLYTFTDTNGDGAFPYAGVIFDQSGNLFGTTYEGGAYFAGTVYELTPANGGWTETVIYSFTSGSDGGYPNASLTLDNAGNLYGTTQSGGTIFTGTVFQLAPANGGWTESVLYSFAGGTDGSYPTAPVILDSKGNLYGTTSSGGANQLGTAFEVKP
jgi:uncharacterized repeat protein (TIGR03803 family)